MRVLYDRPVPAEVLLPANRDLLHVTPVGPPVLGPTVSKVTPIALQILRLLFTGAHKTLKRSDDIVPGSPSIQVF